MCIKNKEYESLRIEILQWQTRRINIYNIALVIIFTYVGWMLGLDNFETTQIRLSWQIASLFPLIILSASMHMHRLFEFYMLKVATYLAVFHNSIWENEHDKVATEKGIRIMDLNVTYASIFFSIGIFTTIAFILKFQNKFLTIETLIYAIVFVFFVLNFLLLLTFNFSKQKAKLICKWKRCKSEEYKRYISD